MARDTARKITRSPLGDHAVVQRNATGQVQLTNLTSTSTGSFTETGGSTFAQASVGDPGLVLYDAATFTVAGGGGNADIEIRVNGSAVTSATSTTSATISLDSGTTRTNDTPVNNPTYTFWADTTGTVTLTANASREQRWV